MKKGRNRFSMPVILIIEDDSNINHLLKEALSKEGYECVQAFSGTEAELVLKQREFSLILLDLMLPGLNGEEVLRKIREQGNIPVIVLTARDALEEKVTLLTNGADDYITKPFEIKEVLARISVQIRHSMKTNLEEEKKEIVTYRDLCIDKKNFTVSIAGTVLPKITKQEFLILELLIKNPLRVFSKEDIFEYAWQEMYMGETKTLDVHISNIRKKIKQVTKEEYIETVWGIGYRLI